MSPTTTRKRSKSAASPLPTNTAAVIVLKWSGAYVSDVIPLDWFQDDLPLKGVKHPMSEGRGKLSGEEAQCDVRKEGVVATLDYLPYKKFNDKHDVLPGVARLTFTDQERTELRKLEWKCEENKSFEDGGKFTYALPPVSAYTPPQNAVAKKSQLVRPRPDQPLFRKTMGLVYGQKCSITGCTVDQVLEAAHIDDYIAPESNHPGNGFLLRSDIHSLFDAHLIAIEPDTHVVHVAPMAQQKGGYTELQGKKINLPKEKTHLPDPEALKRRWLKFKAAHRCQRSLKTGHDWSLQNRPLLRG